MNYENKSNWTLGQNKPNSNPIQTQSNPIAERVKMMQSLYLQRIMKKNAAKGYEKTKPIQTQFKPNQSQFQMQCSLAQTMRFAILERQLCNEAPESLLANQMELSDKLT